jgi:trk system potassium uptake protein
MPKALFSSPGRTVLLSVLCTITCGTFFLSLPISQVQPVPFIDRLFIATSATCVTGLLTVPLTHFSYTGHSIILLLMQIGGLGLITLTIFMMSLFVNLRLDTQSIAEQIFELEGWKSARTLINFIIKLTLASELIAFLVTYLILATHAPSQHTAFVALFHTVSSFCNAGFSLLPLTQFTHQTLFLLTSSFLILIGGFGFITWHEIFSQCRAVWHKKRFHFSLHSKLVLQGTLFATLGSTVLFWLLERNNSFADLPPFTAFVNILFNALSLRSTGFTTFTLQTIQLATFLVIIVISFIGSAPGSTGSGIKTTTFAIYGATIKAVLTGRTVVELHGRRIPNDQVFKAMAVLSLSLAWTTLATFFLLITEKTWHFIDAVIEAFSAFANLGISTGVTPSLTLLGKCIIILTMIIGRIGSITFILALKRRSEKSEFRYPEERVMIN